MMPRAMLFRRSLIAVAIGGGVATLSRRMSLLVTGGFGARSIAGSDALAAWCADSGFSETIGKACLEALPAKETSSEFLAQVILSDLRASGGDWPSVTTLAKAIRERSRDDFRDGRIVTVDGWLLSLTETRVYALAALVPPPRDTID
jgi:hypothetical protein